MAEMTTKKKKKKKATTKKHSTKKAVTKTKDPNELGTVPPPTREENEALFRMALAASPSPDLDRIIKLFLDIMTGNMAYNEDIRLQMKRVVAEFFDFVDDGIVGFAEMQMPRTLRNLGYADRLIKDLFDPEVMNDPRTPYREKVRLLGLITQDTKMRIDLVKDGKALLQKKHDELKAVEIDKEDEIDDLILSPDQRARTVKILRSFIDVLETPPPDIEDVDFTEVPKKVRKGKRTAKK